MISDSRVLFFFYRVFLVCFDGHLNWRSGLEANLLPLLIHERIFNADSSIQLLCILYDDWTTEFAKSLVKPVDILPRDAEPTTDFCIAHRGLMEQTGNVGIFAPVFLFVHHCSATNVNELLRETHYPPSVIFPLLLRNVRYRTFAEDVRFSLHGARLVPICAEGIRQLCEKVLAAQNDIALQKALSELQAALQEYSQNTKDGTKTFRSKDDAA